ncbi:hypothetical protein D9757_001888 [Collybiopsis confluens]|uniref:Peptide N-acetyl-beta-D-glucosaminyl asparaginase amidase A N-terminal domain-containing protein n=1 Tax=Collybiopsis confluens TaxID=2823264 RepID=A0A8H5HXU2_9AGAR|nr:hypothetical protein D9757_001888 [Collybiopsis confluens]
MLYLCSIWLFFLLSAAQEIRDFQVAQPPVVPSQAKKCTVEVFRHDFANSFVDGSAITQLTPPQNCGSIGSWAAITLNLTVTTNGTQFDRLGIFTFHNTEIWRTSTFEPTIGDGIIWTYVKDVTQYLPLFSHTGTFIFELDNLIETGLDGVYSSEEESVSRPVSFAECSLQAILTATYYESSPATPSAKKADMIIPLSTSLNTTGNDASVPPAFSILGGNALEEDWFFNVPDEFFSDISSNITSSHDGFREVRLLIDGMVAGVAFPYITVFYGGFNPSFWRPIGSYGVAELPTYFVDVTPFVPLLTDNLPHNFTLDVVSAEGDHSINGNWYVSGLLQVLLDRSSRPTTGNMTVHSAAQFADTRITGSVRDFGNFNATVTASRAIHIESRIQSGSGELTHIIWTQNLQFSNVQTYQNNGLSATLRQTSTGTSSSTHNGVTILSDVFSYPFSTSFDYVDETLSNWTSSIDHSYDRVLLPNPLRVASTTHNRQMTDGFFELGSAKSGNVGNSTNNNTFSYSDANGNTYTRKVDANTDFNDTIRILVDEIGGSLASNESPVADDKMQDNPNFSSFQFQAIGKNPPGEVPALLKRISTAVVDPNRIREQSPQSIADNDESEAMPESEIFRLAQATSDSAFPARAGHKVGIFGQTFAFSRVSSNAEPSTSLSATTQPNNPSLSGLPIIQTDHRRTSPPSPNSSDNLLYPPISVSQTPRRGVSPAIVKSEPSPVSPRVDVPSSSVTVAIQSHITNSTARPVQGLPTTGPFSMLKGMHFRLKSAIVALSQQAAPHHLDSSSSTESDLASISSKLASARKLALDAQTLSKKSASSAQVASAALIASINEAKESMDASNRATALVDESAKMLTEQEQKWAETAAQIQADIEKMGEWICERERDRERRLQLAREAKEREEKEREEKAEKVREEAEERAKGEMDAEEKRQQEERWQQEEKKRKAKEATEKEHQEESIARQRLEKKQIEEMQANVGAVSKVSPASAGSSNDLVLNLSNFDSVESLERHIKDLEAAVRRVREEAEKYKEEGERRRKEDVDREIGTQKQSVAGQKRDDLTFQTSKTIFGDIPHPQSPTISASTPIAKPVVASSSTLPSAPPSLPSKPAQATTTKVQEGQESRDISFRNVPCDAASSLPIPPQAPRTTTTATDEMNSPHSRVTTGAISNSPGIQHQPPQPNDDAPTSSSMDASAHENVSNETGNLHLHQFSASSGATTIRARAANARHLSKASAEWPGKNPSYPGYDIPKLKVEEDETRQSNSVAVHARNPPSLPSTSAVSSGVQRLRGVQVDGTTALAIAASDARSRRPFALTAASKLPDKPGPSDTQPLIPKKPSLHSSRALPASGSSTVAPITSTAVGSPNSAGNLIQPLRNATGMAETSSIWTKNMSYAQKLPVSALTSRLRSPSPIAPHDAGWVNSLMISRNDHYSPSPSTPSHGGSRSPQFLPSPHLPVENIPSYDEGHSVHSGYYRSRSSSPRAQARYSPPGADSYRPVRRRGDRSTPPPRKRSRPAESRPVSSPYDHPSYLDRFHPTSLQPPLDDSSESLAARLSNSYGRATEQQVWDVSDDYPQFKRHKGKHDHGGRLSLDEYSKPPLLSRMGEAPDVKDPKGRGGSSSARGPSRGRGRGRDARNLSREMDLMSRSQRPGLANRLS